MPTKIGPEDQAVVLKFGGGVNSRASEDEIDPRECASGKNFILDLRDRDFKNREPFELIGQVPNNQEIRGFANLLKSDGTVSLLVQAGPTVYEWDGTTTFTSVGTVSASAKLRGRLEHNWQLDDKVIITDLALAEEVYEWDGTTFQKTTFTKDNSTAFGTFKAKYCTVRNERAIFANVDDNGTALPHLIVGSQRGKFEDISSANRASSALSAGDAWFLIQPDFRAINGLASAFGQLIFSSKEGTLWRLTGSGADDFVMEEIYGSSGASGDESVVSIGNFILYGRSGRLELLSSTDRFGDVQTNDVSQPIFDTIEDFDDWTNVYNSRNQRVYCYANSESQIWTLFKPLVGTLSPWAQYSTNHTSSFNPTAMMNMIDPDDKLEYTFFGDSSGNFYRMEGAYGTGDAGTTNIASERLSGLFQAPVDAQAYNLNGWIKYRAGTAQTVTLVFEYAGENVFNETITLTLPADANKVYYSDSKYYTDGNYYNGLTGKLTRNKFSPAGQGNEWQVRVKVEGTTAFQINEVGLRFEVSS